MGGGGKIPYPKHVWSPAGGWYSQPGNWKANTAIMMTVIVGITAGMWKLSAEREYRTKFPEEGRFFPSRYWSKQIKEHEAEKRKSITERVIEKVAGN
ncbi:c491bc6a-2924-4449-b129-ec4d765baeb9 [Sclerotinia trifoliorum]|uniref:C491bc6a-2924-4449-b129-ec4d765baeb9 n=1 Tax=Sclerotinia trifoliorum TaxID=28548 RepID=A0A8H2ZKW0_9HELO|nr:c491bc6a-2924-4449-b129-ec4d765baeb9 [Sclerotinia trifoliorum]